MNEPKNTLSKSQLWVLKQGFSAMFLLLSGLCVMQAQTDSAFIKKYYYRVTVNPGIVYKDFKVSFDTDHSSPVFFQNSSFGAKLRLKYKWVSFYYTIPLAGANVPAGANPRHFGGTLSLFRNKYVLRLGLRRFKGFTDLNGAGNETEAGTFINDMRMWYNLIDFTYILSNRRYSLRSAFKFSARQLKSKGSFLLNTQWNYQNLEADSLTIPISASDTYHLDNYKNLKIGIGGGYAYTYVRDKLFATLVLTGGGEFRRLIYDFAEERRTSNRWRLSPSLQIQFGCGVTGERYFAGLNGYYLPGLDREKGLNTRVRDFRIQLVVGMRIGNYEQEAMDF